MADRRGALRDQRNRAIGAGCAGGRHGVGRDPRPGRIHLRAAPVAGHARHARRRLRRVFARALDRAGRQARRSLQCDRRAEPATGRRTGPRGRESRSRRPDPPTRRPRQPAGRVGRHGALGQRPHRRPCAPGRDDDRGDGRRRQGRPHPHRAARGRRSSAARRIPALGDDRQPHDRADGRVLVRGDPRGA